MTTVAGESGCWSTESCGPPPTGARFETVNPATEEVLGVVADATADDLDAAITAARRAFDETGWSTDVDVGWPACASCRRRSPPTPRRSGP